MARVAACGAGSGRIRPWGPRGGAIRDNRRGGLVHHGGHAARTGPRRSLIPIPDGARMHVTRRLVLCSLLALAAVAAPARAQSFGKNKVQYEQLQWSVLESPHLRLHFYAEEESLARDLSAYAESVTVEYDRRFRLSPKSKVPLLFYST